MEIWVFICIFLFTQNQVLGCGPSAVKQSGTFMKKSAISENLFPGPAEVDDKLSKVSEDGDKIITVVSKSLGVASNIPVVGVVFGLVSNFLDLLLSIVGALTKNADLLKQIRDVADERIFVQKMSELRSHLITLKSNLGRLLNTEHTNQEKESEVSTGFYFLKLILENYKDEESVLRKFPLHSSPLLMALTKLYQIYIPLGAEIKPIIKRDGNTLLCDQRKLLEDYKILAFNKRLKTISGSVWRYSSEAGGSYKRYSLRDTADNVFIVKNIDYNPSGYDKKPNQDWICLYAIRTACTTEREDGTGCIKDEVIGSYFETAKDEIYDCFEQYLRQIRQKYDSKFDALINSINTVACDSESVDRGADGIAEITIRFAHLKIRHDDTKDGSGKTDPYVKVFLNGSLIGRTEAKSNEHDAHWMKTFKTGVIFKSSDVVFEVWDDDGIWSNDDKIGSVKFNIATFLGNLSFEYREESFSKYNEPLAWAVRWNPVCKSVIKNK